MASSGRGKPARAEVTSMLAGGDRRSIGQSNRVAKLAAGNRATFRQLIQALWDSNRIVRMRAADAIEKASADRKELLQPYKKELLGLLDQAAERELRWHLAQIVPRLKLLSNEVQRAFISLRNYLDDPSSIVRTFAIQGLVDLAEQADILRQEVLQLVRSAARTGTPAMRARSRQLLTRLERK